MKLQKVAARAMGAAAMVVVAAAPVAFAHGKPQQQPNQLSTACGDGTVLVSPENLWPPNHKLRTITITYVETASDTAPDTLSLTINSITDNELAQDPGTSGTPDSCGPNDDDWVFDSTPVTSTDGSTDTIDVPVVVPHNHPKHVKK